MKLKPKLVMMVLTYISFFVYRVNLFLILRRFTPAFTIKSVVTYDSIDMIGVDSNGHEVFRFNFVNDSLFSPRFTKLNTSNFDN